MGQRRLGRRSEHRERNPRADGGAHTPLDGRRAPGDRQRQTRRASRATVSAATTFFDLLVNGYAGVDFNQDGLQADRLHHACERLEADGVGGFLATIITDHLEAMCRRLSALVAFREDDPLARRLIAGLHIEGPFLNETEGYR